MPQPTTANAASATSRVGAMAARAIAHPSAMTVSLRGRARYVGSLIERSWGGERPVALPDGTKRSFLEDGDTVTLSATTPDRSLGLAPVSATILPASRS
jgi:hypothetical protein